MSVVVSATLRPTECPVYVQGVLGECLAELSADDSQSLSDALTVKHSTPVFRAVTDDFQDSLVSRQGITLLVFARARPVIEARDSGKLKKLIQRELGAMVSEARAILDEQRVKYEATQEQAQLQREQSLDEAARAKVRSDAWVLNYVLGKLAITDGELLEAAKKEITG